MTLRQLVLWYRHRFSLFLYHVYLSNSLVCLPELVATFSSKELWEGSTFIGHTFAKSEGLVDGFALLRYQICDWW